MSSSKIGRDRSRRSFLVITATTGAAVIAGVKCRPAIAQANTKPHVSEADPTAKALGYVEDASKVDKGKYPAYKPGARCANCNFFQGKADEAFAPCQIFQGKEVAGPGWCASHSPKP